MFSGIDFSLFPRGKLCLFLFKLQCLLIFSEYQNVTIRVGTLQIWVSTTYPGIANLFGLGQNRVN